MTQYSCEWERVGRECGTDKSVHTYMPVYERLLGPLTAFPVRILELGIDHGNSLKFWLKVFPLAEVHAIDSMTLGEVRDPRLTLYQRFQQDPGIALLWEPQFFDIIVDDGGHEAPWQRASLEILWGCLKTGSHYFIEDILTDAYPEEYGRWQKDKNFLYGECNQRNAVEAYDRADCLVVLKKPDWPQSMMPRHPLAEDPCLKHPAWPDFFRYMESMANPPYTGRFDGCPGIFWDWMEHEKLWRPMWEAFQRGCVEGSPQ